MQDLLVSVSTGFSTAAWTIGTSVVRIAGPVVVAEFDYDKVPFFEQLSDLVEATFACEAAGRTSSKGFVDDGDLEGVVKVLTPA